MIPTPAPDPAPYTGRAPIIYVGYSYDTTARSRRTGRLMRGWWFTCRVPAVWNGQPNPDGRRVCVLFRSAR